MESTERRLPVYLLLDCSESMIGEGIEGVTAGVRQLLLDLHSDPHALETVWISILTFAGTAQQILPLTEMIGTKAPRLKVQPGTALGAGLRLLNECINREVRTHSATHKGDYKPLVFLLTGGDPTDTWRADAKLLKAPSVTGGKKMNLIGIGCGQDANPLVLNEIADSVLMMGESELDFRSLFRWISSSLSVTSQQIGQPGKEAISLAKIPAETFSAPSIPVGASLELDKARRPNWLFLSERCCQTRAPFLTRFGFDDANGVYTARQTHVVDEDYFGGPRPSEDAMMGISSENVLGILPCPHCDNRNAGQCPNCQNLFCAPEDGSELVCPFCETELSYGGPGGPVALSGRVG